MLLVPGRAGFTPAIRASAELRGAPELTIVVPTLNERDNVPKLIERIETALDGIDWELMFVDDDSADGTAAIAKTLGRTNARIRCIRRIGRRGLAGACLEGMLASQARYVAVIDGDLQHDEALLAPMLAALRNGSADLVVGSRYTAGGSADVFTRSRLRTSRWATAMARSLLGTELTDPMSGYFMSGRESGAAALHARFQDPARYRADRARSATGRGIALSLSSAIFRNQQARLARPAGIC
jgi:dolichol-phosphate mannosyltransferase